MTVTQKSVNEDGTTPVVVPEDASLISKITVNYDTDAKKEWSFTYDANKRLTKAIHVDNYDTHNRETFTYDFTYAGNSVKINIDSRYGNMSGSYDITEITAQLNSEGYISSGSALDIEHYSNGIDTAFYKWNVEYVNNYIDNTYLTYSPDGKEIQEEITYHYTWSTNGNLTKIIEEFVENEEEYITISNVTYNENYKNDKTSLDLNWLIYHSEIFYTFGRIYDWSTLAFTGLYGKRSTYMVSTEKDEEGDYSYNYEVDKEGRINKVKVQIRIKEEDGSIREKNGTMIIEYK